MGRGQARKPVAEKHEVHFVSARSKGQSMGSGESLLTSVYWVWLGSGVGRRPLSLTGSKQKVKLILKEKY